jgi:tetratricopeptide (TPR) repeat protein
MALANGVNESGVLRGNESSASRDEALYREGMAHLQAGEWAEAIRCFEALSAEAASATAVRTALDEARFKARLEAQTVVRPKRWTFPWRMVLIRVGIVVLLAVIGVWAVNLLSRQAAPMWARAQAERQAADLVRKGEAFLQANKFDEAEAAFRSALQVQPDNAAAEAALARAAAGRELATLYDQAVALQQAGDLAAAQQKFLEVTLRKSDYRDASQRIADIKRQLELQQAWQRAEDDFAAGRWADALAGYEEVKALNATYQKDLRARRMFECYMRLGEEIVQRNPPAVELVPKALEYFTQALAIQPRDMKAATQQRAAAAFLAGRAAYEAGRWDEVITALSALHTQQPGYLAGAYLPWLYEAYLKAGDSYRDAGDFALAWAQYHKAASLPLSDTVVARARLMALEPLLTPTPTPTITPTPTLIPTPTPLTLPKSLLPPTPAPPLTTFRGQILFWSDKEDEPGLWVMNPDGSNRRYLGSRGDLRKQYEELLKKESLSPDGRYRVYTTAEPKDTNPQVYIQGPVNEWGKAPTWQVSKGLVGTSYDPVWSPDGSRIAFVSQEKSSDDIWVANVDGTNLRNCTPNDWEWDKHPSWSPDSNRIVFWSNRTGIKQIYVMDANCQNLRRITNTQWDEYDPLWVK